MMRLSFKKAVGFGAAAMILGFGAFQVFSIYSSARKTLAESRARQMDKNRVPYEKKILTPHLTDKISFRQNTDEKRAFVKFKNSYFAATGGGLVEYDEDGNRLKHFTVLDGLPESDLTALIVFNDKLFIGTRTKNLVVFDGGKFENYRWTDRDAQAITTFLESDGRLLIGTFAGGLLEFDGAEFTEIKAADKKISAVNCLAKSGAKLFIGTFDNGIWTRGADGWRQFTKTENLPSNRVVGFAENDGRFYAATDLGLAFFDNKDFQTLAALPDVSSLISFDNQIFLTRASGEIFTFDKSLKIFHDENKTQNARLVSAENRLWIASNDGIFRIENNKIKRFGEPEKDAPTSNFASALAFDSRGNCWLGTFRRGIDVFSADGKKIKHLEDETTREINFLKADGNKISAATSAGLIEFKPDFSADNLTKNEGLPSDSVTHFAGDFIATAKGLVIHQNGKSRVVSAVNNLPNEAVYTILKMNRKLYAGTLGGLAEIENGRVVRAFRDSNSNLKTNWVTALLETGGRVFIGTYGGGIFELSASGEIRSFAADAGNFVVNPNALYTDGKRLFAGTLSGVKIFNIETREWKTVSDILPSPTVLSIAADDENIYFGTSGGVAKIEKNYFADGELK